MILLKKGTFERRSVGNRQISISLTGLSAGTHQDQNIIFSVNPTGSVDWVISRICDHAGGPLCLSSDGSKAVCPLHGWVLDLKSLSYENVAVSKQLIDFEVSESTLIVPDTTPALFLPQHLTSSGKPTVQIRFLTHACLLIDIDGFKILTDPWLMGPCFLTGWWHLEPPKDDALFLLREADIVYISHNHADHMHEETLLHLLKYKPNIDIIFPEYASHSVINPLKKMGFTNLHALQFGQIYQLDDRPIHCSIFKSGDFRDDSGLFISSGEFSFLATVDAPALNNLVLPTNVTFLATNFAGVATGYPWCFEDLGMDSRKAYDQRYRKGNIVLSKKYIEYARPKNYMPYAGFNQPFANRDSFIKDNLTRNTSTEIIESVLQDCPQVNCIDPLEHDLLRFEGGRLCSKESVNKPLLYIQDQIFCEKYIVEERKRAEDFDIELIRRYFLDCEFVDNLIVYVQPCEDEFDAFGEGLMIDFSNQKCRVERMTACVLRKEYDTAGSMKRKLFISVRYMPLWTVIGRGLPWEELMVGYQCKIWRKPDVYNSDFWFYFTNNYICENVPSLNFLD